MKITQYKDFQVLSISDIELLQQCFQRLAAEGKLTYIDGFGEFMDVIMARKDYKDTRGDEFIDYDDIGSELVQGPNIIFNSVQGITEVYMSKIKQALAEDVDITEGQPMPTWEEIQNA